MDNLTSSGHTNIVEVGGDKVAFVPGAGQTLGLEYFFDLWNGHLQTDNEVSTQVTRASEERGPSVAGFARIAEFSQKQQAWRSPLRKLHVRLLYFAVVVYQGFPSVIQERFQPPETGPTCRNLHPQVSPGPKCGQ
jgi:hypothetical protein